MARRTRVHSVHGRPLPSLAAANVDLCHRPVIASKPVASTRRVEFILAIRGANGIFRDLVVRIALDVATSVTLDRLKVVCRSAKGGWLSCRPCASLIHVVAFKAKKAV